MKIAIIGSAPSSIRLAPYQDPTWQIWGCSPGTYAVMPRCDTFFELHRWEPGVIGKPETQKPWFSPEYVAWMAQRPVVWMRDIVPQIPGSKILPVDDLISKYGSYFFTSSIAWMLAMAINAIQEDRKVRTPTIKVEGAHEDSIGLFGVDMAANEEYADQRPGCQFFVQLARQLDIEIIVPPESDLMAPPMLYGIGETDHMMVKMTERRREIETRLANANAGIGNLTREAAFLTGALDDINYVVKTWVNKSEAYGADFKNILNDKRHGSPQGIAGFVDEFGKLHKV